MKSRIPVCVVLLSALLSGAAVAAGMPTRAHGGRATQALGGRAGQECARARSLRYVPRADVCVDAFNADVSGDGQADLVLLYGRAITGAGPTLAAYPQTLEVVAPGGAIASTRLAPTSPDPYLIAIGDVDGHPGEELFVDAEQDSSGSDVQVYSLHRGQLIRAGDTLNFGGDSADRYGFDCVTTPTPEIIQRDYALIGPTIYGRWRLVTDTYRWAGATLHLDHRIVSIHHGLPGGRAIRVGAGCGLLPRSY